MLNNLTAIVKKRKRIGRGGSRGGTSGRGHKGQKARSGGGVHPRFEGGQMPLVRRLPKRGFSNARFKQVYQIVNLSQLEDKFEDGTIINAELLIEKRLIKSEKIVKVKILGNGLLNKKLVVHADAISQTAQQAILDKGGQVFLNKEI